MGAITIAFGASVLAGIAGGVLGATRAWADGVRPRRLIRERDGAFTAAAFVMAIAVVVAATAIAGSDALRASLAVSCAAAAVLFAVASWLFLVEPDDDSESEPSLEPSWWPQFERDFTAWSRTRRRPTASRG
jgi:hypothetical protein